MRTRPAVLSGAAGLLLAFPFLPGVPLSLVVNANLAGEYALIAISLVVLTGWVGQISLGQGSFVGIGAFATGLIVRDLHIPFPANLPLVAAITASVAALLGVVALRVRGLYLAVATLIFAWMTDAYLFSAEWFSGTAGASTIPNKVVGRPGTVTAFDLSDKRVFYYVALAAVVVAWYLAQNIRDSKTGRAFFAIRGSEMAAVSLGIDVTRYKLLAFALSGALAGIAGNLIMTDLRTVTPVSFQFTVSLFYLSIAVVGGITSLGGAIAASILFAGLNELFFRVSFLTGWLDLVTVGILLVVIIGYPGGLGSLGHTLAERVGRLVTRTRDATRLRTAPFGARAYGDGAGAGSGANAPERSEAWRAEVAGFALPPARDDRRAILEAEAVTVRFGGLIAVNNFSLSVREHEIVGLIGPNGAGKTTLFNALSGLVELAAGTIRVFEKDVTREPVHERARMGVGRTFQLIQLFPQLTVFDNLLVATHTQNRTGVLAHLVLTSGAAEAERRARREVRDIIELLGLEDVADRRVAGLPFGILRQVEIARALVTKAPILMLDEPASGLDNSETDELTRLLYFIRSDLGTTMLLIEHDVRMVTAVSDYIYVVNRGTLLAEGAPGDIQRDPEVIAAYLGETAAVAPHAKPARASRATVVSR